MRFPAPSSHWPTGREMGDYLEAYARHFDLPVRSGTRVERVEPVGRRASSCRRPTAPRSPPARSSSRPGRSASPNVPAFAGELDPSIRQLHSHEYRNPSQLQDGPGPRRRPVPFRRRHRVRGRERRPPDDPLGQVPRPDADPGHRHEAGRARLAGRRVRRSRTSSRSARRSGRTMRPRGPARRRPAPAGPPAGPRRGRRRAPRRRRPSACRTAGRCSPTAPSSTWPT